MMLVCIVEDIMKVVFASWLKMTKQTLLGEVLDFVNENTNLQIY